MKFLSKKLVKLPIVGNVTVLKLAIAVGAYYLYSKSKAAAPPAVSGFSNYFRG